MPQSLGLNQFAQGRTIMDFGEILRSSQPVFQFLSAIILLFTLLNAAKMRRTKALDLANAYQTRYNEANWREKQQVERGELSADIWYEKFWNLQLEQYQYWRMGYIPSDIFEYWLRLRRKEWETNSSLGEKTYREGWHLGKACFSDPHFAEFMNLVFDGDIRRALHMGRVSDR